MKIVTTYLFFLLMAPSGFSQKCEAGAGVLIYTVDKNGEIFLLLADHEDSTRGWASFGGGCQDKSNSVRQAAIEELEEETRGYFSQKNAEELIRGIKPIENLTSKNEKYYTYIVKATKKIDTKKLNELPPLSDKPEHNERDTYHLFKLTDLISRIKKSENGKVELSEIDGFPKNKESGAPTSIVIFDDFLRSLKKALEDYQPFKDYQSKLEDNSKGDATTHSTITNDKNNNCDPVDSGDFYLKAPESIGGIYKRIILQKDGLTLNDIPQYGYKEDVYFEIEDLPNDETSQYVFAYKYLETMDQPFLIHRPDDFGKRVKSGNKILYKIPANPDKLRNRQNISGDEYQKSKNREVFLVYNLYKVPKVVDPTCLAKEKEQLVQLESENRSTLDEIAVIDQWLREFPNRYAAQENADSIALKNELEKEIVQLDTLIAKHTKEIEVLDNQITFYQANYYVAGTPAKLEASYDALLNLKRASGAKTTYRTNRNRLKTLVTTKVGLKNKKLKEAAETTEPYLRRKNQRSILKTKIKKIDSLREKIADLEKSPKMGKKLSLEVIKLGGLVKGNSSKTISYELGYKESQEKKEILDIKRMGNFPVLTERDHIYALITNHVGQGGKSNGRLEGANYSISLSILEKDTALTLPNSVRPTLNSSLEGLYVPQSGKEESQSTPNEYKISYKGKIYQDLLIPFGKTFRRNSLIKARFHGPTYTPEYSDNGEVKYEKLEHKLLLKETYPQVRGLYGFNLSTGIISSFVDRKSFSKAPVTGSSPNTFTISEGDLDEARILPMIALTIYWKPVDIQRPPQWTEMIPNPTIGFDFTSPTNEIFLGASSEFFRNIQLVYGVHFSKVDVLAANQNLSTAEAPKVEKKFASGFFAGLTFNFNLIPSMYKQFFTKKD